MMPDDELTLDYARPTRRRWPWWADVLFAIVAVGLAVFIIIEPALVLANIDS